eukprot:gene32112-16629_t
MTFPLESAGSEQILQRAPGTIPVRLHARASVLFIGSDKNLTSEKTSKPATAEDLGNSILQNTCVYKPPDEFKVIVEEAKEHGKHWPMYSEEMRDFMMRIFVKSGLSPHSTYLHPSVHPRFTKDPTNGIDVALLEAEMVMGGALDKLLQRTGIKPSEIDILVTCCSIFCPTPSLASMLVNKFSMRSDVQSYHLGGTLLFLF